MGTFEDFENDLREGLAHLYDPTYHPPPSILEVIGEDDMKDCLIQAIEALKPAIDTPPNTRARRFYNLLSYRYVQEFTQVKVAQELNITPRHLRREQQQAIHVLAHQLWEQFSKREPFAYQPDSNKLIVTEANTATEDWYTQVQQELVSLEENAPGAVADVGVIINSAVKIGGALAANHGVTLQARPSSLTLIAAIHPSLLSQILMTAIEKLIQAMDTGQIILDTEQIDDMVRILVKGRPVTATFSLQSDLIQTILSAQNGTVDIGYQADEAAIRIQLPSANQVGVLVVDDNRDLVHWYRRYTAQTRYTITHLAEGQFVFDTVKELAPEVIVLDVMLPDIDGWELLTQLHEHPDTRRIPVIICSVVKRKELALALGATIYLPKPVHRQAFIQALDLALVQVPTTA